uniref:Uncharacterized protein n=1 Tax=Panagrolaimus superbus TaxID=310955 RepID=A0A914XTX4_9BILA
MAEYLQHSKRQDDLLRNAEELPKSLEKADKMHQKVQFLNANADGPQMKAVFNAHELQSDRSRMKTSIGQFVEEKRLVAGNAQAEHMVNELYSASQINRGPPGAFASSRLHLDMLLGRDEKVTFADYLNFDYNF